MYVAVAAAQATSSDEPMPVPPPAPGPDPGCQDQTITVNADSSLADIAKQVRCSNLYCCLNTQAAHVCCDIHNLCYRMHVIIE
jgi:hypothetical protein